MSEFNASTFEQSLHLKLLQDDADVVAEVVDHFLVPISTHLKIKFPFADEYLRFDAVTDAIFNYTKKPKSYDPNRRSLLGFLKMAAEGDLRNALTQQKKYESKLISFERVEFADFGGNNTIEETFIAQEEAHEKMMEWQNRLAEQTLAIAHTALDAQLLELIQKKERRTLKYAQVLGITHLPDTEQKHIVKQHKDRLKARARRREKPKLPDKEDKL